MHELRAVACIAALAGAIVSQTNTVAGLDGSLTNSTSPTQFGRRGTYPNGETGMSYSYTMCNPGRVAIPWNAPMNPDHPMFAYMVVRESNGRMEQVTSPATTYVKHSFAAANSASTCGGTCTTTGTGLRINCTDTYGASTNANRFYLGPADEIDPWTGIWNPVGSYFDRGDPDVGFPANADGARSLSSTQTAAMDTVKNRVTLRDQDLLVPGRLFYCMHIVVRGESGDLHFNNFAHRQMTATWNGSTAWTFANTGVPFTQGTVLQQWAGSTLAYARNGNDDGHFFVAVKVTQNPNGTWHYEYAVQNFDNHRGGASLRIPVDPSVTIANVGFRDTDLDPANEWSWSRQGGELLFGAAANNPLNWNNLFNFWFDSDAPPAAGSVAIDQARLGNGGLTVNVQARVPSAPASAVAMGTGCGSPAPVLAAVGRPTIPSASFGMSLGAAPGAGLVLVASLGEASVGLGNGCTQYLDTQSLATQGFYVADGAGTASVPLPIPANPALEGLYLYWQAVQLAPGGAAMPLSNGLRIRIATL